MTRFEGSKKSRRGKKKSLYTRVRSRQPAKKKPLLHGKGITQTSYEAGFFDFLKVFWNNNRRIELCSLTKQVANAWEALLPKPKLSKKTVLRDYSQEFKLLQREAERQRMEENKLKRIQRNEKVRSGMESNNSEEATGSETDASRRSNFDDCEESSRSERDISEDGSLNNEDEKRSQSQEDSNSEINSSSQEDSGSEYKSNENIRRNNRRVNKKRKGRKYESYDAYLNSRNKRIKSNANAEKKNDGNNDEKNNSAENANTNSHQTKQEEPSDIDSGGGVFFPIREMTSFDRIVKSDFDDQDEMLRKLKLHARNTHRDAPDRDDTKAILSDDSFSSPVADPKFPQYSRDVAKLTNPTDTLHVKNLVLGIRQPELQDIFRIFLHDIVLIRVLDNKFNGEAVVEFKTVEAAEKAWRQMNGVEYKRIPLTLEFVNKEDLIY